MTEVVQKPHLLALSLAARSGCATFDERGRLLAYTSCATARKDAVIRAAERTLAHNAAAEWLVSEGETKLAATWERSAMKQGVRVQRVDTESWRAGLELHAAARGTAEARRACERLARRAIDKAGMPQPVVLAAGVAEAICVGLWAARRLGLLPAVAAVPAVRRVATAARPRVARAANA